MEARVSSWVYESKWEFSFLGRSRELLHGTLVLLGEIPDLLCGSLVLLVGWQEPRLLGGCMVGAQFYSGNVW